MKPKLLAAAVGGALLAMSAAEARITRLVIDPARTQSPAFEGRSFGSVGQYEKLRGVAHGELDPADPRNAVITDIELAPRNAAGKVTYSMDVYILRPMVLAQGNGKVFMEVNNRGSKLFGPFNGSTGGNDPTTAAHAGDAFIMNLGYSLAWNGWDFGAGGANAMTINVGPPLKNPDGSTITGPNYEYIVNDNATTLQSALSYPAATLDKSRARLTVKPRLTDPAVEIPASGWEYTSASGTAIRLLPVGTPFQQSAIYEFEYVAKDPVLAGVGFAATRDFVSFLKYAATDDHGNPNPLAGHASHVLTWTFSQPARYLNDFETLGFNEDESGRIAIDGIFNWAGGGNGIFLNYRFANSGRTERNRQNHRYPEGIFPFAYPAMTDPFTGQTAGRASLCAATNTCPKAMQVNSANEYWVKTASLLHSDPSGKDLPRDPDNVRFYLLSGVEHTSAGSAPNSPGNCQQPRNTSNPSPVQRALFVALDAWVTQGIEPPPSAIPEPGHRAYSIPLSDGVGYVPQDKLGWPSIPGVTYNGVITVRHRFDFGPRFGDGIMDVMPPLFGTSIYPSYVSKVDHDGNEVAGIRLPTVAAPIATHTGWALRRAEFGGPDGCEGSGQAIAFETTKAARLAKGDPRPSLQERYKDHAGYVEAVAKEARKLEQRGLLLPADVQRYIDAAQASDVLR